MKHHPMDKASGRRLVAATLAALQIVPAALWPQLAQAQQTNPTRYEYDAQGNLTKITDPNGKVTTQVPDALNRIKQQTLPAPSASASTPQVYYTYDGQDRLISVKDPLGNTTTYTRSGLDDVTQASPDTGSLTQTMNVAGDLATRSNQRSQSTSIVYDELNRPQTITYKNSANVVTGTTVLSYDAYSTTPGAENYGVGRLTQIIENTATGSQLLGLSFAYDQLGRITRRAEGWFGPDWHSYDTLSYRWAPTTAADAGRLRGLTYPSGRTVDYQYDALGRVIGVTTATAATATAAAVISNVLYTPLEVAEGGHVPKSWNFGATPSTPQQGFRRFYDSSARPWYFTIGRGVNGITGTSAGNTILYDEAGRVFSLNSVSTSGVSQNQTYAYDDLNRLTHASMVDGASYDYSYDQNGNRTLKIAALVSTVYSYPTTSNKVSTVKVGTAASQAVTTDSTGNITQDPASPAGQVSYTYDDRNPAPYGRLIISKGPGAQWSYQYNHLGQRQRKTGVNYTPTGGATITPLPYIGSTDILVYYDMEGHLIAEENTARQVLREYIWLGDTPIAVIAGSTPTAPVTSTNAAAVYYIHTDHLDTPRLITDTAGNRRWEWPLTLAEPFGATPANEAPLGQAAAQQFVFNLRFPGQYLDKETGTFYNYFRTYNPQTGRYLQSDPIGLGGGLNIYAYVKGNPLNGVDPKGLRLVCIVPFGCSYQPDPPPLNSDFPSTSDPSFTWPKLLPDSWVESIIDRCKPSREKNCEALRQSILNTCASLSGAARARCVAAANESYRQCMSER